MIAPFPDLCLLIFFSLNVVNWSLPRRYFSGGFYCFMSLWLIVFVLLAPYV